MIIQDKIAPVDDNICEQCDQLWDNLCCAFRPAHSLEERHARSSNNMACEWIDSIDHTILNRKVVPFELGIYGVRHD